MAFGGSLLPLDMLRFPDKITPGTGRNQRSRHDHTSVRRRRTQVSPDRLGFEAHTVSSDPFREFSILFHPFNDFPEFCSEPFYSVLTRSKRRTITFLSRHGARQNPESAGVAVVRGEIVLECLAILVLLCAANPSSAGARWAIGSCGERNSSRVDGVVT